jgi:glycosyltransferase involved in cell wall biosynthesis
VIPAYNAENYIKTCLESFCTHQAKFIDNIDVIFINDGSKDGTLNIAREYEKNFSNFKVHDQANKQYGGSLNYIIQNVKTKYIKILDVDDWFNKEEFEKYVDELLKIYDFDLVFTNYKTFNCVNNEMNSIKWNKNFDGKNSVNMSEINLRNRLPTHHAITFSSKLLSKMKPIPEGIYYTDSFFVFQLIVNSRNAYMCNIGDLYTYRIGNINQSVSSQTMVKNSGAQLIVFEAIARFMVSPELEKNVKKNQAHFIKMMLY